MENVVVIFQATQQETESLALAFGLGAVQAGANIRLRHLDPDPANQLAHSGYGTLKADDLRWAEGVGIFLESGCLGRGAALESSFEGIANDVGNDRKLAYVHASSSEAKSLQFAKTWVRRADMRLWQPTYASAADVPSMIEVGQQFASEGPAQRSATSSKS